MIRLVGCIYFFCWLPAFAGSDLTAIEDFGSNPGNLEMFVYKPAETGDSLMSFPLVIALHGCSQTAAALAEQSGWNKLADTYRFMVLYPQQKLTNNPSGCFNWFQSRDINPEEGELASIMQMITYLNAHYNIDSSKIMVYGLSAGAGMGVAIMANFPTVISGGALFAGGPFGAATNEFEAYRLMTKPQDKSPEFWSSLIRKMHPDQTTFPRLIVVHGEKDNVVDFQNASELIDQWKGLIGANLLPVQAVDSFAGIQGIERLSYKDSSGTEQIIFYKMHQAGHVLSVDPGPGEKQGGATGMFARDLDFFSTYYIAQDFGLIQSLSESN